MSCCRGRRKIVVPSGNPICKTLEDGGARTAVQVLSTNQGHRLVIATQRNGFLDLGGFLEAYKCNGATARLLRRYLPMIQRAFALDSAAFAAHRSGISITTLIRVAEQVTKRQNDVQAQSKVPSYPSG